MMNGENLLTIGHFAGHYENEYFGGRYRTISLLLATILLVILYSPSIHVDSVVMRKL